MLTYLHYILRETFQTLYKNAVTNILEQKIIYLLKININPWFYDLYFCQADQLNNIYL